MRFAISIPQFYSDGTFDPTAFRTYVRRAEALGYHSGWTQEQVLGAGSVLSPAETMTYAASCTETLRLGCSVFVTPLHNPVHLAKTLSSLDQISRGRLEIGVGSGGRGRMFSAFGVDPDRLISRFTESLQVMKELWTQPKVDFEGRFWQLSNASMEPKPFQKPHPPVWFGGSHPAALRRAVRLGDGFFGAGSTTTANFADQVRTVREALTEASRDPETFPIAKRIYIAVDDDVQRAREHMSDGLAMVYGDFSRQLGPVSVAGTPEDCVQGVQEVVDAGAELVLFTPLFDQATQMERLATEVIPHIS